MGPRKKGVANPTGPRRRRWPTQWGSKKKGVANPMGAMEEGNGQPNWGPRRVLPVPVGPKKEGVANPTRALEEGGGQPNGGPWKSVASASGAQEEGWPTQWAPRREWPAHGGPGRGWSRCPLPPLTLVEELLAVAEPCLGCQTLPELPQRRFDALQVGHGCLEEPGLHDAHLHPEVVHVAPAGARPSGWGWGDVGLGDGDAGTHLRLSENASMQYLETQ